MKIKCDNGKKFDYNVLIFGAGGRQVLPVCKGFYELGCNVTVYCGSRLDTGYLTRYSNSKILFNKDNGYNQDFNEYGIHLIKSKKYDLVLPLGDNSATFLSKHKEELQQYARIAVNDWDTFQFAIDKSKTMQICMKEGIDAPLTVEGDVSADDVDKLKISFPVVVKPKTAVGSIGFNIIKNREELKQYLLNYDNCNGPIFIQEYIEQGEEPQYRADLFRDREGQYKAALVGKVTRWYPLDGGSGIFAITIHNDEIINNCKRLLDAIEWNGYANIDMVWDIKENKAKILEINGRTGASIKQDYISGVNMSQLILENELGLEVADMTEYEDGKKISCLLPDLLWLLKSPNRFKANPSWFARRGVKDVIFSWDDPLPFFAFLLTSIMEFGESMKKRKRFS